MNPGDALEADLPPPRDDEPPALRRDIIDELADHLECSFRHELLRGQDPVTARARAIERFGDPAALARRLWLDAMKGKIMKQRLLIGAGVASLALTLLAWAAMFRAEADRSREMAQIWTQNRQLNEQIVVSLREMNTSIRNQRSFDWNPVHFELFDETPEGAPVVGASIVVKKKDATDGEIVARKTTDARGEADLGFLQPGEYTFTVDYKFASERPIMCHGGCSFKVEPGSEIVRRVVCPKLPRAKTSAEVVCEWPSEFQRQGLVVLAPFVLSPFEVRTNDEGSSDEWTFLDERGNKRIVGRAVLFEAGGPTTQFHEGRRRFVWSMKSQEKSDQGSSEFPILVEVLEADREPYDPETAEWEVGPYQLSGLMVLRPIQSKDVPVGRRRYELIAGISPLGLAKLHPYRGRFAAKAPDDAEIREAQLQFLVPWSSSDYPGVSSLFKKTRFTALPDQSNHWKIDFPDELSQELRKVLKKPMDPSPKKP